MSKEMKPLKEQNKLALWAGRITDCRNSGQSVKTWCRENGICEQTYFRWQKRLVEMTMAQQEVQFTEITPPQASVSGNIEITIRLAGMEVDIHSGADMATIEAVLRVVKSC